MIITLYSSSPKVNIYPICKLQKQIKGQKWETSPLESLQLWRWAILKWVGPLVWERNGEREKKSSILAELPPFFSYSSLLGGKLENCFLANTMKKSHGYSINSCVCHVNHIKEVCQLILITLRTHPCFYAHTKWKPVLQLGKEKASTNIV